MANKTIHQLSAMNEFDSGDEFAVYDTSANTTGKMTIANVLGTSITGLGTTATTIPGAISELNTGLGTVNTLLGSGDISSIGDGSVTGAISSLNNDLADKVNKAGDTMSGNLGINKTDNTVSWITLKSNNGTVGTTPTSDTPIGEIRVADGNGEYLGYIRGNILKTTGNTSMEFISRRTVSGSSVFNSLSLKIDANGTRSVSVTEAAPWLVALGLNNLLQSKNYNYEYTVAANTRIDITVSNLRISTPSGYTPIAATYINTGSQFVFPTTISPASTNSNTNVLVLKNTSSSSVSATASIRILYVKTSFYHLLN